MSKSSNDRRLNPSEIRVILDGVEKKIQALATNTSPEVLKLRQEATALHGSITATMDQLVSPEGEAIGLLTSLNDELDCALEGSESNRTSSKERIDLRTADIEDYLVSSAKARQERELKVFSVRQDDLKVAVIAMENEMKKIPGYRTKEDPIIERAMAISGQGFLDILNGGTLSANRKEVAEITEALKKMNEEREQAAAAPAPAIAADSAAGDADYDMVDSAAAPSSDTQAAPSSLDTVGMTGETPADIAE